MWSIVVFDDDHSLEAVPSFWLNKNICAWPKKKPRKYIISQSKPNKKEFLFLKARKIGIDYGKIK